METKKPNKQPGGAPQPIVIQKIEVRPWQRQEVEIPDWRNAVQSAESQIPRRTKLYSLYADVVLDAQVEAAIGKRMDAVLDANWQFVDKEGKPVDEVNHLIDTIGFTEICEEILNARFWGYTILEPRFWQDPDGRWHVESGLIPRLNYRPEKGIVAFDIYGDDGINIREGIYARTVMEVGKTNDLGLLMKAAPYQILKRGGLGDYANFIQVFGHPFIDATWNGFDEKQRLQLKEAIDALGAGGAIIRPDGTNIELKENNTTANGDAQAKFIDLLNREISKALLGTTETIESSSSSGFAQSQTHAEADNLKQGNDLNYVRRVLNSRLINILKAHGFDVAGGQFIIQGEDNELSLDKTFEIHKSLVVDIGLPIADDFFYETYGIPKPEGAVRQTAQQPNEATATPAEPSEPEEEEEGEEDTQLSYGERVWEKILKLFDFFGHAPEPTGAETEMCGCDLHTLQLAEKNQINDDALIRRVADKKGKASFDIQLFDQTAKLLADGFKQGWDSESRIKLADIPSFAYGDTDPAMLAAFEHNIFRFSAGKTLAEVELLNRLFRRSTSFDEFFNLAKGQLGDFNKAWLETEFTTAVLTGESAALFNRLNAQKDVFPFWEYRTVRDGRVRPWHEALDGVILPAGDPLWNKIFPPNGWNCRCRVLPRLRNEVTAERLRLSRARAQAYIESPAFAKEAAQGFGINKGDSGMVFGENQMYIRRFIGGAEAKINQLNHLVYGMPAFQEARKIANANVPVFTANTSAFLDELEDLNGERVLRDFNNKPMVVSRGNLRPANAGRTEERTHRVEHLSAAREAIAKPHEVWLQGKKFERAVYVRYYNDDTAVAIGEIENGRLVLKRWFLILETGEQPTEIRKGLIVLRP